MMNRKFKLLAILIASIIIVTIVLSNYQNQNRESDLSGWVGIYEYKEMQEWGTEDKYVISVYEQMDNFYARIYVDGLKVSHEMKVRVEGDNSSINLILDKFIDDNSMSKNVNGDTLFTLSKEGSTLSIEWIEYQIPEYDTFQGKKTNITLKDKQYDPGSNGWVVDDLFKILMHKDLDSLKSHIREGEVEYCNLEIDDNLKLLNSSSYSLNVNDFTHDLEISTSLVTFNLSKLFETYLYIDKIPVGDALHNNAFKDFDINEDCDKIHSRISVLIGEEIIINKTYIFNAGDTMLLANFSEKGLKESKWFLIQKENAGYDLVKIFTYN